MDVSACIADRARLAALPGRTLKYRFLKYLWSRAKRTKDANVRLAAREDGLVMEVDRADIIDFTLWWFGVWEPTLTNLIGAHLQAGDVGVDIGANIGSHTLTMARAVGPSGRVVAVEPGPETHQRLRRNADLNALSCVDLRALAAGDSEGRVTLYRGPDGTRGRASIVAEALGVAAAEVTRVRAADLLTPQDWARVRLIKIDVERAEAQVLRGLQPIAASLPDDCVMLIEAAPKELAVIGEQSFATLLAPFSARGWRAYALDNRHDLRFMLDRRVSALREVDPDALPAMTDIAIASPAVAQRLAA
jgi:FkbM family methyltransferase